MDNWKNDLIVNDGTPYMLHALGGGGNEVAPY